jgi:hypothetical protein
MTSPMLKSGGAKRNNNSKKMKGGNSYTTEEGIKHFNERLAVFNSFTGPDTFQVKTPSFVEVYQKNEIDNIGGVFGGYCPGQKDEYKDLLRSQNKDCVLVVNAQMPFPEWFPADNSGAGMSYVHLLAVPRKPFYNIISGKKGDIPLLNSMKKAAIETINSLSARNIINTFILDTINFRNSKSFIDAAELTKYRTYATKFLTADPIKESDIEFAFHMHPDQSVPQLHLHCILLKVSHTNKETNQTVDFDMRTGNESAGTGYWKHAHKNFPLLNAIEALQAQSGGKKRASKKNKK